MSGPVTRETPRSAVRDPYPAGPRPRPKRRIVATGKSKPVIAAAREKKPAPAAPTAEQVARAEQAASKLCELIASGVAQGRRENVYIEFAGRVIRARLVAASAEGGTVRAQGVESPLDWETLSPRRFYGLARKYTDDHRLLAAYCRGVGLTREAREEETMR